MEEYIADLQEQLITAQHRFMKMHRDLCFTGLRKSQGFSFYRFYLLHIYTFCVLRLQVLFLNSSYRHDHKPLIKKRKKSLSVLWAALWN